MLARCVLVIAPKIIVNARVVSEHSKAPLIIDLHPVEEWREWFFGNYTIE